MYRSRLTSLVLVMGSLASCAARTEEIDKHSECSRMRDHVLDLRIAGFDAVRTSDGKAIDLSAHRDALRNALGPSFVDDCVAHMSDAELACRKTSTNITALRGCATH